MENNQIKKQRKLDKLLEIVNVPEKEIRELNFKEKQEYYKAKCKLGKMSFISRDKKGKGITYVKPKTEENK